ncbi:hypothetical protein ABXV18_24915 [Vibrio owensii]|uniref:hypothetical protein n=1 Tax=Vibrio owensii TaxID=696485 RepID=UPI0033991540
MYPHWFEEQLRNHELLFESPDLKKAIWQHFLDNFDNDQFDRSLWPQYSEAFFSGLLKTNWISDVKKNLTRPKRSKAVKLSPNAVFKEKVVNFFSEGALEGEVVNFSVEIRCTGCQSILPVSMAEYRQGMVWCDKCKNYCSF